MAGRNAKTNFDFFRLDTDFFSNKKIKALRRRFGSVGILTFIYILSYAYGNDGYYIKIDSVDEFAYDIAESIGNSNLTQIASVATDCINYLASRGEINKHLLDKGVISGESIQRQYIEMCMASKRKLEIKEEYRLVDTSEYPIAQNAIYSEEMPISSEEITINSGEIQQSKVNKKKVNKCPPISPKGEGGEDKAVFFKSYPLLAKCKGYNDSGIDYKLLGERFKSSQRLKNTYSMKWVCDNYQAILSGLFADKQSGGETLRIEWERWLYGRKFKAESEAEHAESEALRDKLYSKLKRRENELIIQIAFTEIKDSDKGAELDKQLKETTKAKRQRLAELGIDENSLKPQYSCGKCSDTGYLSDGSVCMDCWNKFKEEEK